MASFRWISGPSTSSFMSRRSSPAAPRQRFTRFIVSLIFRSGGQERNIWRRFHMAELQQVFEEAVKLNRQITQLLKFSTYPDYDNLSGLDGIDRTDGE